MTDARTDTRVAALAEALQAALYPGEDIGRDENLWIEQDTKTLAAAILAALPPDWCGHGAEIARLRNLLESSDWRIKKAEEAREVCHNEEVRLDGEIARLRAECDGLRGLAKSGAARAHLDEAGVMVRHNGTLWECKAERCIKARELAWTPEERAAKSDALRAALAAKEATE